MFRGLGRHRSAVQRCAMILPKLFQPPAAHGATIEGSGGLAACEMLPRRRVHQTWHPLVAQQKSKITKNILVWALKCGRCCSATVATVQRPAVWMEFTAPELLLCSSPQLMQGAATSADLNPSRAVMNLVIAFAALVEPVTKFETLCSSRCVWYEDPKSHKVAASIAKSGALPLSLTNFVN